jgi:uncharacterized membrane protein affecting hemolysin expression
MASITIQSAGSNAEPLVLMTTKTHKRTLSVTLDLPLVIMVGALLDQQAIEMEFRRNQAGNKSALSQAWIDHLTNRAREALDKIADDPRINDHWMAVARQRFQDAFAALHFATIVEGGVQ